MSNVVDLLQAKQEVQQQRLERLLSLCTPIDFPRQEVDQVDGAVVSLEGEAFLRELFQTFGVTELDPQRGEFDLVLNTWYELTATVFPCVRVDGYFDALNRERRASTWHPAFTRYVDAVVFGSVPRVCEAARELGIQAGIPEGSPKVCWEPLPAR